MLPIRYRNICFRYCFKLFELNNLIISTNNAENVNIPVIFIPIEAPAKMPEPTNKAFDDFALEHAIASKKIDNDIKHAK